LITILLPLLSAPLQLTLSFQIPNGEYAPEILENADGAEQNDKFGMHDDAEQLVVDDGGGGGR